MKKSLGLILISVIYVITILITLFLVTLLSLDSMILKALIGTVIATLILFTLSTVFNNSSIYDAYWSVQPMVILPFFVSQLNIATVLLLGIVFIWGVRLTVNWAYTFESMQKQDWRYSYFKKTYPKLFPLINVFGIHLMPTFIVFMVMLPGMLYLNEASQLNSLILIGALVSVGGILLESIADVQAHRFRKSFKGLVNNTGLWKYSRHPNYLGEILMWFGIFIMLMGVNNSYYLTIIGPILNLMLFMFISIPLMEKRQCQTKPEYKLYQDLTNPLLLSPKKAMILNFIKTK